MKKNIYFVTLIVSLIFYGSFSVADLSEAKDKMSRYDRQIFEEFNNSFQTSSEGRFQIARIDDTSIFIIDTKLGHLWTFYTSPQPIVKYAGKVHPGRSFWKTIYKKNVD